ncbi:MAG: M28 family peptidase [Planctomycetota bacterium]|nr:M28 family peptidase [Planctomycetota bacterium]
MTAPKLFASIICLVLAAACSSSPPPPPTVEFDQELAWDHLESIVGIGPRPSGSEGAARLRDYLEVNLEALGLETQREPFTNETPAGPIGFENLFVDLPPTAPGTDAATAPWILVGTHFDTKLLDQEGPNIFVGANDGGSGTAILLELARVLTQPAAAPREVGLRLLFLDGEEAVNLDWEGNDNTYGSRYHAERLLAAGEAGRFGACVILDMLGDRDLGILHETYSRRALMVLFEEAAQRAGLGRHMQTNRWQAVRDDHQSFLKIGIPSVDLIDFDYGPLNSWWHTNEDTLDKCSAASLGAAGTIVLTGLPDLERWVLDQQ